MCVFSLTCVFSKIAMENIVLKRLISCGFFSYHPVCETLMFIKHSSGKSNFHSGLPFSYPVVIILCVISSIPIVGYCNAIRKAED